MKSQSKSESKYLSRHFTISTWKNLQNNFYETEFRNGNQFENSRFIDQQRCTFCHFPRGVCSSPPDFAQTRPFEVPLNAGLTAGPHTRCNLRLFRVTLAYYMTETTEEIIYGVRYSVFSSIIHSSTITNGKFRTLSPFDFISSQIVACFWSNTLFLQSERGFSQV